MKNRTIKIVLLIALITATIFGISSLIKSEVNAVRGQTVTARAAGSSTPPQLAEGETNPDGYSYHTNTGTWEALNHTGAPAYIATYGDYQIYCINPGSPIRYSYEIRYNDALAMVGKEYTSSCRYRNGCADTPREGDRTPPVFKPVGTYDLPVAAAYIISDEPIGSWTLEKQRGIWNLRDETIHDGTDDTYEPADDDLIIGGATSSASGPSKYDQEAKDYAEFDSLVREEGIKPENQTDIDGVTTKVNQSTGEYTVGPFNINYTSGIYGNIAFGGITEISAVGYNYKGEEIKDIKIEKIILKDKSTGIYGEAKEPQYFEPDSVLKIDTSEQVYPEPGQDFEVVYQDPNEGLEVEPGRDYVPNTYDRTDEEDEEYEGYITYEKALEEYNEKRVSKIKLKVKFQYMLANGKYTKLKGTKYTVAYKHDHSYNYHFCYTCHHYSGTGEDRHHSGCHAVYKYGCKTTCYLEQAQQQWLMATDAIRSIYEVELEMETDHDTTMELGGNVWEDVRDGKETIANGRQDGNEPPVEGIPVILYNEKGYRVAATYTDADGEYKFVNIDPMRKYYIRFRYNGQQYENTVYEDNLSGGYSNATESTDARDAFNAKFEEVDGDENYTLNKLDTYEPVQPFAISAYTGSDGKNDLRKYPEYDTIVISDEDVTIDGITFEATYEPGDDQREIDFGITRRIEFDMALKKDVYAATVKINGKTEVYGYDKRNLGNDDGSSGDTWQIEVVGGYERGVDDADYNFRGENGNNQLLEIYVTYKVAVRNQSMSMLGHVTKLYDYYDETYEYMPELSWSSGKNYRTDSKTLDSLQDSMEAGKVGNNWGEQVDASDRKGRLTIDVGKKQASGETVYLYLTFKINGEGPDLALGEKVNSVEIGAFKTYYKAGTILPHYGENNYEIPNDDVIAGRVDRDSIPSSMGPNGRPEEDDEDEAPGLDVHLTGDKRKMNGTVWEDERNQKSGDSIIGNGLKDDGEKGIAGVKVELVEKTVQGKEYIWKTTTTAENGTYNFEGYIPGDYVVRFHYGNSKDTVATKANGGKNDVSYNGQDFKSTTYQTGVNQKATTDLDGEYKGYKDVNGQNETGTYGYDIAESYGKNVSDAKDIWSRRQAVNAYSSKDVTNGIAEILASPYQTPTYNGKEYTSDQMNTLMDELAKNTYMIAETGVIVMEVEYNTQSNLENGNPSYPLKDIDFGLTERPKAQLETDKSITNIKLTLANGNILFDVNKTADNVIWKDHEEYNLGSKKKDGKYEEYYGKSGKNRYSYRQEVDKLVNKNDNGLIQLTMDEELMHGATIQITYKVKVTNVGETDYVGQNFYYKGTATGTVSTTTANTVIDYIANNLQFAENNYNAGWKVVSKADLTNQNLVNSNLTEQINKFNNVIKTEGSDLDTPLKPGDQTEKTLVLTQLITTENTDDDLTYSNLVEIAKTSNTLGRRMAYSTVGNQNPTANKPSEVDSSMAEKVIILPPFGEVHIYYILGAVIAIMLAGGITLIIRKVLKK